MNWRDFLTLATRLAGEATEAEWRTGVSRAYYAAFHVARDLFADLQFAVDHGEADLSAAFDWRQTGPQSWDIEVETEAGFSLKLAHGGSCLELDGRLVVEENPDEYAGIYRQFSSLLREGRSEVDIAPFRLVADAFMIGKRVQVEPFED